MKHPRPIVVRPEEAVAGPATVGMERRQLFEGDGRWAGWVRTDAGTAGGWHHHGGNDSYIYVLRGTMAIDYGRGGSERVEASAGDFVFNPANLVHREVTGPSSDVEALVLRVGDGPQIVNVDGPDPA